MARMISIHEYELKPGTSTASLEQTFWTAESRGLFELPGLTAHHFVKAVKGDRRDAYAAVWVYESPRRGNGCGARSIVRGGARTIPRSGGSGRSYWHPS